MIAEETSRRRGLLTIALRVRGSRLTGIRRIAVIIENYRGFSQPF
jgi:hypothetical protein